MANPIPSGKRAVDLAAPTVRVSRIRRDPPPPTKVVTVAEIKERDARNAAIGVVSMALALFAIVIGLGNAGALSPSEYTIHIKEHP